MWNFQIYKRKKMSDQTGWETNFLHTQLQSLASQSTNVELMARDMYHIQSLGNAAIILTSAGVIVVDTGNPLQPDAVLGPLRTLSSEPVHWIIYTHGHADHAANVRPILADAARRGYVRPHIVGHRNVLKRMDRYAQLHGLNDSINRLQFQLPDDHQGFPPDAAFVRPDLVYEDQLTLSAGNLTLELHHAEGETDDATWIYIPERKALLSGDVFISSCPNSGNPLKLQRYSIEWAHALEQMAACNAEVLGPGHGTVVREPQIIKDALLTTAYALHYLHDAVVQRLNAGQWEEQIIREVTLPQKLANSPWLAPVYGKPSYIIRDIYRRYRGWWNGKASQLAPAPAKEIAHEVLHLAGGADALLQRVHACIQDGNAQLALHLLDFVLDSQELPLEIEQSALTLQMQALQIVIEGETSYIGRSIYEGCLRQAQKKRDVQ
jgi:alkyl sulfatase BDS1-like metallo-beta-lactamase superfamily hydrolase